MKSFPSVLALVLCLAMAGNAHSGTSSSYKSGFSSQKNNAARGHGSPASAQPRRNTSAMSRDVDQGAARANALKTLEARRAAANTPPPAPLPPLNDTLRRPQQPAPVYQTPPPVYQPPMQQPSGNGLMHGLMGFMLGRAMSQSNQPVSYPTVSNGQPQPAPQPAAAPAPSFGVSVLRWFIWLALLSVIVWTVVYSVRKLRRLRAANTSNYSFERN